MKKIAIMMLACAAPAFAGEPAVDMTTPAPVPPAPAENPWTYEMGMSYSWATNSPIRGENFDKVQTIGVDVTACYKLDDRNSLNMRLGYGWGDSSCDFTEGEQKLHINTWTLMPGYRYTYPMNDKWSVFAGANIGVAATGWKEHGALGKAHDSAWGFAYSAEAGLRYQVCPNADLFVGYVFSGNTAKPSGCREQVTHGVRFGFSMKF